MNTILDFLSRRFDLWVPSYIASAPARAYSRYMRRDKLTHIMFLICDHFEPRNKIQSEEQPATRMRVWQEEYGKFQKRCITEFGHGPLHSWFYPPHHGSDHLPTLSSWVFNGWGEVELHYHHDNDTADSLRVALSTTLLEYNKWGLLLQTGMSPTASFGFIHGDWALANSCDGRYCGVNEELKILQELGCWGDFTMPSANKCQTRKINSIYYASGSPLRPKSHNTGVDAQVGKVPRSGLLLMQGPLGINWSAPDHPRPENASLTTLNWGRPDRIRKWLDCQVHLKGRPEWLFVKLHSHGAIEHDFDALFGEKAYLMHRHLNNHYNDGKHFKLHYVTARQAYNIAKAAEADMEGDPTDWIDFRVSPPATSLYTANSPHTLVHCTAERLTLREIRSQPETKMQCRVGPIRAISGAFTELDIDVSAMELRLRGGANGAATEIEIESQRQFTAVPNMLYCGLSDTGRGHRSKIILTGETVLKFQ